MPFSEGTTALPTDRDGVLTQGYLGDDGLFRHPRADGNRSLKVALWGTNSQPLLTNSNPGIVYSVGANLLVLDIDFAYTATTPAATVKFNDFNHPATLNQNGSCYIAITNPSTASALTLSFQNKETFNFSGTPDTRYVEVSTASIAANKPDGVVFLVQGWLMGDGASRLVVTNVSTTEASAIAVHVKIRRV